jgi:hypothetical protein
MLAINISIGFIDVTAGKELIMPGRLIYYSEGLAKKRTSVPRHTKARAVSIPTDISHVAARRTIHKSPIRVKGTAYASTRAGG